MTSGSLESREIIAEGQNNGMSAQPHRRETDETLSGDNECIRQTQKTVSTGATVLNDGRIDIQVNERQPGIAGLLNYIQQTQASSVSEPQRTYGETGFKETGDSFPLRLNILIQIIGCRGDIQPFVALGQEFKTQHHRVRIATHAIFRNLVLEAGLEFFDIGGDPEQLMTFMVQNPSLIPGFKTIRSGAIQRRRREMRKIIDGCWRSCFEAEDGCEFVADAIIANPPSLAHIHCAQRLGIPLHIMFTMPWSPTQAFPHPLAVTHPEHCKETIANFISYAVVDMMVWEGLGDIVNTFRRKKLSLDPLDRIVAPSIIHRLRVPCAYLWSPYLLAKPRDWPFNIDICGFCFLPPNPEYKPPADLEAFLNRDPKPIYIGFGSIVVEDPTKLTQTVFDAVKRTGQRALISKGWGNIGTGNQVDTPDNILLIGSLPHDWLFRQVSCIVHHGGAGTTAAGLALGCPTVIISFFGDQQFWGRVVASAGAGQKSIPYKELTVDNLTEALQFALLPSTKEKAHEVGENIQKEAGTQNALCSFHRHLDAESLRCAICPSRPAKWLVRETKIGLSGFAAAVLVQAGKVKPEALVRYRCKEYDTDRDPRGPVSAGAQIFFGAIANLVTGVANPPTDIVSNVISARNAIHHPHTHSDPQTECGCPGHGTSQGGSAGTEAREREEEEDIIQANTQHASGTLRQSSNEQEKLPISEPYSSTRSQGTMSEAAHHSMRGLKKLLNVVLWLPTDLTLSMTKGFHNAPKLYHDATIQPSQKITGFRSGLRAARTEFKDGFYYGITGLFTQPRDGLRSHGGKGLAKGAGKGVGGVILKPTAGLWGLAGYPLSGLRRKLLKSLGKDIERRILLAQILQAQQELQKSSAEERAEVVRKWVVLEARPGSKQSVASRHSV